MQVSISYYILILLLYFLLGFTVATLELCFQHLMTPGMIFNWYALLLLKLEKRNDKVVKPLGLCPYCNGIWIGIVVYIYIFSITWEIFLFIGIVWFFIKILKDKLHV